MQAKGTQPISHLAQNAPSLAAHIQAHKDIFFLVVGWLLPGPPFRSVVFAFQRRTAVGIDPVFDKLFEELIDGSDEQRMSRFKYLPRLDVAPQMVLKGVKLLGGEKPTMLTKKLTPSFYRGDNYFEVNIDIASSKVANMVAGLILPKVNKVVVSHGFILEGHSERELPEKLMAAVTTAGVEMVQNTVIIPTP